MRVLRVAALLVVGGATALAAAELAVRAWAPQELTSEIWTFDGPICHQLRPGARGHQVSGEFRVRFQISDQGLRDRFYPTPKPAGTTRILLLGDSHTFGFGVAEDSTYVKRLERRLNALGSGGSYEVLNAGTMGYGTGHEFQHFVYHSAKLDPDLVVIAMNFLHDVDINNELFEIEGDSVRRNAKLCKPRRSYAQTRFIPFMSVIRARSHAFRYAGQFVRGRPTTDRNVALAAAAPAPRPERFDLAKTQRIFELFQRELDRRGIDFAVAILSIDPLRAPATTPHLIRSRQLEQEALAAFEAFLAGKGIPFVSFAKLFRQSPPPAGIAFERSLHYTSAGHRLLAHEFERFLVGTGKVAVGGASVPPATSTGSR